jgi:succinylarginine dihydrolase
MHVHKTRKHHVTHGERYSLLARQNEKFESTIAGRANVSADEIHGMTEDAVIDNGSFFNYLLPILSTSLIHC